jgi:hypothetical protein
MLMVIGLAFAAFAGTILTFTYATILYAFTPLRRRSAAVIAVLMTFGSLVGLSVLAWSQPGEKDAGGLFVQMVFIVVATGLCGPLGSFLAGAVIEGIEQKG